MLSPLLFAALLAAPAPPAQADTTFRIARGATISIDGGMRSVTVRGTEGDQVTVKGAEVSHRGQKVSIDGGMPFRGGGSIVISVPRWARVDLSTLNGDVTIDEAPADVKAEVVNGNVSVTGGSGTMSLSSATGMIRVRRFAGTQLDIEAIAGNVEIDGASGSLSIESVNNPIILRNITATSVDASSTNGGVTWHGDFAASGRYHFASHNGLIELHVPRSVDARLRMTIFNGGFDTSIPATTTGLGTSRRNDDWPREREVTATYGRGSATVEIETFNGQIRVRALGDS